MRKLAELLKCLLELGFDLRECGIELRRAVNLLPGHEEGDHRCHEPPLGAVVEICVRAYDARYRGPL